MTRPEPIRVMIADDRDEVRSGLTTFLKAFDDMELVGQAENGAQAVALCLAVRPDVVLMDLAMPEMDGIGATRLIRRDCPVAQVIALTAMNDQDIVQEVLRAGAFACIMKNASIDALAAAIRAASGRDELTESDRL